MRYGIFCRKKIAFTLLFIWCFNLFSPLTVYALTSGPTQPETKGFQPAGVSDMVDLFTGDMKYNIPLMDVGGYPINLNYQSGIGIDDEASWVGLGWNINVGAINRQLRGLPDDLSGDNIITEHYTKPKVTVGGRLTAKVEFKGKAKAGGSLSFGVFSDNYTGIGAELGANAGMSFSFMNGGGLTAGLGLGILSNTSNGVNLDVSPSASLSISTKIKDQVTFSPGLSASLGYNSRGGMKDLSLGKSFGVSGTKDELKFLGWMPFVDSKSGGANFNLGGTSISYNTDPVNPRIEIPFKAQYGSFSFDVGGAAFLIFGGGGGTGYKSVRQVLSPRLINKGYGFLYAERGKGKKEAVMDFIREKENPVIPELPNLALPVHTPDLFSYTSQGGSGQFRLYRGGTGAFFDNEVSDVSEVSTLGFDAGIGAYAHGGVTNFEQNTKNITRKWRGENTYLNKGDFQEPSLVNPDAEHVFFRQVGERNVENEALTQQLYSTKAIAVNIQGKNAAASFRDASHYLSSNLPVSTVIKNNQRRIKRTVISHLTAKEASLGGLEKQIRIYPFNPSLGFVPDTSGNSVIETSRVDETAYKKTHHISEISVTGDDGKRTVYGIPVYNIKHEEYSFAVGRENSDYSVVNRNQVPVSYTADGRINHKKGIDHYYHKETQPAYASSFLLTAILSPDYVDKTGNGISRDDAGTAIKFNYSKLPYLYKWRTPYQNAALNRSMLADPDDDKASIVYGEKEIYYIHSIESKTMIAYFITEDRLDGVGVLNWKGEADYSNRQKCLKEIRLYSKADLSKPVKIAKFEYSYELCPGAPNSTAGTQGKLTLKKVYFQYGNTDKGKYHPYIFSYNNNAGYGYMTTDRWGVYKSDGENLTAQLTNEEFPYTGQTDRNKADQNASQWHLSKIELPTGGVINVSYEADDYAFVQNRRAMVMSSFETLIKGNGDPTASLKEAKGLSISLPEDVPSEILSGSQATQTQWFKKSFLENSDFLYTKLYVKISTPNSSSDGKDFEYVPCYAKVRAVGISGRNAKIFFEDIKEGGQSVNPILVAAWQRLKNEYPRYAYPGFDKRVKDGDGAKAVRAAVSAIIDAARNLSELKQNFYEKAFKKGYASSVNISKSFIRITKADGYKLGGGVRVKKIQIADGWTEMSGSGSGRTFGQSYDYTTVYNGRRISSGVASYEPSLGGDENPMRQPVPYIQKIKGALNNFFTLEEPFGESFFPAPTIGYSKVTVRDLNQDGNPDPGQRTGYIVNEFYTSKEFPVLVKVLDIQKNEYKPKSKYSMLGASSIHEVTLSQGYSIMLNDMHGKPRATRIYNQTGSEIASTVYNYLADKISDDQWKLHNRVNIINQKGLLETDKVIGRDIEFFTDMREQETANMGKTITIGGDLIPGFFGIPLPIPHWPTNENNEYKLFRSVCAVKVVQYFGIIDKVTKTENGSSISTQNVAYDGITGEALVTKTQNEFKKDIYSITIPAYWTYKGMGGAYTNQGIILPLFTTSAGVITTNLPYLNAGDELLNINSGKRYWIAESGGNKVLIDSDGKLIPGSWFPVFTKIVRSGLRNMLQAATTTLVCLNNPIQDGKLRLTSASDLTSLKVINASVTLYDEKWALGPEQGGNIGANQKYLVENTSGSSFTFGSRIMYSKGAYLDFVNANNPGALTRSSYWGSDNPLITSGPFKRSGIWPTDQGTVTTNSGESLSFDTCITVNRSGDYYVGAGSSGQISYKFDNSSNGNSFSNFENRWIINKHYLTAGKHRLTVTIYVEDNDPSDDYAGLEIYDNTLTELKNANSSGSGINILFSTAGIRNKADIKSSRTKYSAGIPFATEPHYTESDGSPLDPCYNYTSAPVKKRVNPYVHGYYGNWLVAESKVYQEKRNYSDIFNASLKKVGVKDAGYISNFFSYWVNPSNSSTWTKNESATQWITANTVTLYDQYSQELENKDALGRYSSATFDFNGELPASVASNAMNREVYVNSFEDSKFQLGTKDIVSNEFTETASNAPIHDYVVNTDSHTGNYSVTIPLNGFALSTLIHNRQHRSESYLMFDPAKGFMLKDIKGLYPKGFEPSPKKKYIFNVWVKDGAALNTSVNIQLKANTTPVILKCKAIVEGWKLLEGIIDLTDFGTDITPLKISITPNSAGIQLDDIRIHPYDAHLKSYAYNDKNFRLMAELDENCFATFYEYDDEGTLIRVKKETEHGIVTLKESRSSYKKRL